MLRTDTWLVIICSLMVNAVIFGAGAITVLSVPLLADIAKYLLPAVIVASFATTPFVAAVVARRMRIRNWSRAGWRQGDFISG